MDIQKYINELAEKEIVIWCEGDSIKFKAPKGAMTEENKNKLRQYKSEVLDYLKAHNNLVFTSDTKRRYEKFPLTDIQNSYVMGRNRLYELGGIGCHGYIEIEVNRLLDPGQLEVAWNKVIQKHDMLRAIVSASGYQIVQEAVPSVEIIVLDGRDKDISADKEELRTELSTKQYQLGTWPMCDLALSIEKDKSIIYFSLDMLISDFASMNVMLNDLERFYENPHEIIIPTTSYRDIVLYQEKRKTFNSKSRQEAEVYWNKKISMMGDAPNLPVIGMEDNQEVSFLQKKVFLNDKQWKAFVELAKSYNITPSVFVMAALAEVIAVWSGDKKFCINTTLLNRPEVAEDIYKVVGDFTDVNITAIDIEYSETFLERVKKLQMDLWSDLEHKDVSGVEIIRRLTKERKKNVIMPVVFTSTLGVSSKDDTTVKNRIVYKLSQTPQVYIDCQAAEENGGATINWDVRNGVFEGYIIEEMFGSFALLLQSIADKNSEVLKEKYPVSLMKETLEIRRDVNNTFKNIMPAMLEDGFLKSFNLYPDKTALITDEGEYTYRSLGGYVNAVLRILGEAGTQDGDKIGIDTKKHVWQVAAVLAALISGATYVPIDVQQPDKRKEKIIRSADIKLLFSEAGNEDLEQYCNVVDIHSLKPEPTESLPIDKIDYDRPAYIIFTSGTTGEPKGVIMTHRATSNTIADVNETYAVGERDVFLGLSNLSFDLSVYDLFGCFSAGGTLVLPSTDKIRDSKYLSELIIRHRVSVINAVPALHQMIVSYLESANVSVDYQVRLLLLSGDWIPVTLPHRIYDLFGDCRVISLGGATEAAIWSISYDISKKAVFTKSIPYGYPMSNQTFYVLNNEMQPCPNGVDGSLYIGGIGLSSGYLKDEQLNREKYPALPWSGERIYRTGDKGCYLPDGVIIFKGREDGDNQVKIHGHRVELAEISSVLNEHPLIERAVALALGESPEDLHIDAVISPVRKKTVASPALDDKEEYLLKSIKQYYEEQMDQDLLEKWIKKSEEVVSADIYNTFRKRGIFSDKSKAFNFEQIVEMMSIPEKLHKLTKRWLQVLVNEGIITCEANAYKASEISTDLGSEKLWKEFFEIEDDFQYSKEFVDYLKESSDLLPELIQGKEDPLNILFPKGDTDPALAAYHDNKVNGMLNNIATKEIRYLCEKKNKKSPEKPFRILEVGAGVGGTSLDVIPELEGCNVEYYFTDLSVFFLNKAQENFGKYNWVKYGIFNINEDFVSQGYEAFSFDVILCANVLHNSRNINSVMKNLKGLLSEDASIIILEETRTSYLLLTSMEFKDGLTGFTDERSEHDQTFFTRKQWEDIFKRHDGQLLYEFPDKGSKLDLAGQTIYVVRFAGEYEQLEKEAVRGYLESTVSPYMVPNQILILPDMPLSANRKVDTRKIKEYFKSWDHKENIKKKDELPQTDLERRIAEIWCKELGITSVGRNDDFYLVGGDSLLIAQIIGKMMENISEASGWEWSNLLTEMMKAPTIKQIAESLLNNQNDKGNLEDPSLMILKNSSLNNEDSVAKVFFHAGAGTLTPYTDLLSRIKEDSKDSESIIGFVFGNDAEYISMETSQTFRLLGRKYGEILEKMGYKNYILVGHCVGGLIALETAQYLRNKGISVSDVTLISTGIPKRKENTILADASDEIFRNALHSSLDNELLLERIFARVIGADAYKAGYQVSDERLQQYIEYISRCGSGEITVKALCETGGEYEDVAEEFRRLASYTISERLNALYRTIERPNGELMEHQLKMLNVLFRIFSQNFRCVSSYIPKLYYGNIRIFCCEILGSHFYPGFFEEDFETWKPYIKGNLKYNTIAGQHFDCIIGDNLEKNISKILDFNY